jgi:hypothetical protein
MENPNASPEMKLKALGKALHSHREFIGDCLEGRGCDRHLLGLRLLATMEGKSLDIFNDPAYKKSTTFILSTR